VDLVVDFFVFDDGSGDLDVKVIVFWEGIFLNSEFAAKLSVPASRLKMRELSS